MTAEAAAAETPGAGRKALLAAILLSLAACTGLLLFGADRGLDLTDETFYLIWIDDPAAYEISYQPFGHVLNPIYELLGRSLAALRMAGVVLMLLAGAALGLACERFLRAAYPAHYRSDGLLAWFGALAGLSNYFYWLATPNYNYLGNVGACLAGAGLIAWTMAGPDGERRWREPLPSLLFGIGFYFSFFGKPPLAAIELVAAAIILALQARRGGLSLSLRRAAISGGIAALLGAATIMRVGDLLDFLPAIFESRRAIDVHASLAQLPATFVRDIYQAPPIFLISLLSFLLVMALPDLEVRESRRLRLLLLALLAAYVLLFSVSAARAVLAGGRPPYTGLSLTGIVLLGIAIARLQRQLPLSALALLVVLAFAPFAVSLGALNSIAGQLSLSIGFPLLAAFILARLGWGRRAGPLVQGALAGLVFLTVLAGALRPHEYPSSIFGQTEPLSLPLAARPIRVDPTTKAYAEDLRRIARESGFVAGSPVVDLTAGGPGTVILFGGRAPVVPWLAHVAPQVADIVWRRMSEEERRKAWIVGPIHPVFADTALARHLTRNAPRYRCAGETKMKIWGRVRPIAVWQPVAARNSGSVRCSPETSLLPAAPPSGL